MKRYLIFSALTVMLTFCVAPQQASATDPISQIILAGIKKVIRAVDIAVQRLQNETIKLQNVQKQLENLLSKLKLDEIYQWSKKQTDLFSGYYDELQRVRSAIAYYKRVKDVVNNQVQVVKECQRAITTITKIKAFKPEEVVSMVDVYTGILEQSLRNVDQLYLVIRSFATQMDDAERLALIHRASDKVDENLADLREFTNQNLMLGMQRVKEQSEINTLQGLYNIATP